MKKKIEGILNEKLEKGISVSPVLPEGVKNYLIDRLEHLISFVDTNHLH